MSKFNSRRLFNFPHFLALGIISVSQLLIPIISEAQFKLDFVGSSYIASDDTTQFSYSLCWPQGASVHSFAVAVEKCPSNLKKVAKVSTDFIICNTGEDNESFQTEGLGGAQFTDCQITDAAPLQSQENICRTFHTRFTGNRALRQVPFQVEDPTCDGGVCLKGTTTGASCDQGNLPPVCNAGGPYNVACGLGVGFVELNGLGSSDPDCNGKDCQLSYNWESNCPEAIIDNISSATPSMSFNTTHPPGVPLSCTATLTVFNGKEGSDVCSATINVAECEFDCNEELGGNATFDDCGVCQGLNGAKDQCGVCFGENKDLDQCGVCNGNNLNKDECGVCFGDGQSCQVNCTETSVNEQLFALDGLGLNYLQYVEYLARRLEKLTKKNGNGKAEVQKAKSSYLVLWKAAWSLPPIIKSECSSQTLTCTSVSNEPILAEYSTGFNGIGGQAQILINKIKKTGLKVTSLQKRKANFDKNGKAQVAAIPKSTQICG